jgi:exopolysaccharide biosynthesis protein
VTENVADGVVYIRYSYKDTGGKPYEVYTLELDPTKVDFYMGSGNDSYEYIPTVKESVKGHIESAAENGQTVYAGVNGDFFRISSDYSPIGLTVKEGVVINENTSGRGYVGFTADGECIIDDKMYATSGYSFKTAVGGNQILLRNGLPYNTGTDDEFSLTAHPRTLVGVRADGTVLLVVIDGRQSAHSNGAPLKRCAKIMFDLGASSALNVDGGGSSTMCTVSQEGKITTKNSPSDFSLRRVYNSILVVKKEQ